MLVWVYVNISQKRARARVRARRWQSDCHLGVAIFCNSVVFPMGAMSARNATCLGDQGPVSARATVQQSDAEAQATDCRGLARVQSSMGQGAEEETQGWQR